MDISALVSKEFQRIATDKRTLVLLFIIPAVVLVIFGLSSGGGPTTFFTVNIITRDSDASEPTLNSSEYDEGLIYGFMNASVFTLHDNVFNATDDASYQQYMNRNQRLLRDDVIDAFIVIPANFSEMIENETTSINYSIYIDASDAQVVSSIHVALQEPVAYFRVKEDLMENLTVGVPYLEFDVPFWMNQVLNYAFPIVVSMIMLGTCMNLTSLSIVSEQPLARMLLAPTGKTTIVFSKLVANFIIMVFQATEIFAIAGIFGLFSRGPLILVYLSLLLVGLVGICIGLFISSVAKTEQVANQMYIMFFIAFTLFCKNFLPMDQLPPFLRGLTDLFPLSKAIPLLSDIMYKGLGFNMPAVTGLVLTAGIFYLVALVAYAFKNVEA